MNPWGALQLPSWTRFGLYPGRNRTPFLKRALDVTVVLASAFFWLPILLLTAVLVRCRIGPRVIFRQARPGLCGKPFDLVKFRTMTDERDSSGNLLSDAERLTGFGRWLRSTSLDELPELLNVLRGEMSLVGPRPLLQDYLGRYSEEQARRHQLPPGLTGWAQISGRNALTWEEKFRLDCWYIDHASLGLDLWIIFQTIVAVIRRKGISPEGDATMPEFHSTRGSSGPSRD